jgi:hypothetical protein
MGRAAKLKRRNRPSDSELQAWLTSPQVLDWVEQAIADQAPEWGEMMTQLLLEVIKDKSHDHIISDPSYRVAVGVDTGNWSLWTGIRGRNRSLDTLTDCPHKLYS